MDKETQVEISPCKYQIAKKYQNENHQLNSLVITNINQKETHSISKIKNKIPEKDAKNPKLY